MRQFIFLCVLCLAIWAGMVAAREPATEASDTGGSESRVDDGITAPGWVDFSILPDEIGDLRELDSRHREIARRAARNCATGRTGVAGGDLHNNPCVLRRTAEGLNQSGSEELKTFHYALPLRVRYDGMRTEVDWRQPVEKTIADAKTAE